MEVKLISSVNVDDLYNKEEVCVTEHNEDKIV